MRRLNTLLIAHLWLACLGLGLLAWAMPPAWSQTVQPVPVLSARIIDQTGTLNAAERQALENQLAGFEQSHGSQIVALLVPTTQPEDIASYANRVANTWKIGRQAIGDGVLIIVAKNDRRMRIEVAKGLEGAIPDLAAARVIDQQMTPRFRTGDFAGGLQAAVAQITRLVEGENLPAPPPRSTAPSTRTEPPTDWFGLGLFVLMGTAMFGSLLRRLFGKFLGPLLTGAAAGGITYLLTGNPWFAAIAGLIGLVISFLAAAAPTRRSQGPIFVPDRYDPLDRQGPVWGPSRHDPFGRRGPVRRSNRRWGDTSGPIVIPGGNPPWSRGGDHDSGGDSGGGFSSGGGGDFGGGGASGSW